MIVSYSGYAFDVACAVLGQWRARPGDVVCILDGAQYALRVMRMVRNEWCVIYRGNPPLEPLRDLVANRVLIPRCDGAARYVAA